MNIPTLLTEDEISEKSLLVIRKLTDFYKNNKRGWTQKSFVKDSEGETISASTADDYCSFCIMGGLEYQIHQLGLEGANFNSVYYSAARKIRYTITGKFRGSIVDFNDAPRRTRQQVIKLLEKVA